MQVICISRGTFDGGRRLAERLAAQLGYTCLSREEVTDAATGAGIPVGQIEMAVVRRRPLSEAMALQKDRFRAWVTASLCERALAGGLVYHGRAGHLQLPGAPNVLRVRTIMDADMRIALTERRLGLGPEKAEEYNEQVDEDRHRWVRTIYNRDWQAPELYDLLINLSHLSPDNAASVVLATAQLPEFQASPAGEQALRDLLLAARCRLALGEHTATRQVDAKVTAEKGSVLVTYPPRNDDRAREVAQIIEKIQGVNEVVCTMASTNLLWIQEAFEGEEASLPQVLAIAGKWNAAVELIQLRDLPREQGLLEDPVTHPGQAGAEDQDFGGILDEDADTGGLDDTGISRLNHRLISAGRAGGVREVRGGARELVESLDRTLPYNLVIVGRVFLSKGEAVRKRLSRDLASQLAESLKTPVINADELTSRFLFGRTEWLKMIGFAAMAALIFGVLFSHQQELIAFLTAQGNLAGALRAGALIVILPAFAYCYGNFTHYLLRLFKFE